MKNPRFAIFAVAVIAVGALVALVLFERHELWRAHTENLARREQAQNLTAQRKSLRPPFTEPEISVPAREKEFSELLRLRGEVGRLRLELSERGNGRSDVAQAPIVSNAAALPWRVAFGTELRDVGAATPERAANMLVWAALQGDRGRVADLLELPAGVSAEDAPQHYDFFTSALSNKF